jgi:ATP-dependent Clp protease ATP-binding subunit ClpA
MGAVFERFTEQARQVVVYAQEEARELGHGHVGTEHLLLGLLREEDGIAARVLAGAGVELEAARGAVRQLVGRGEGYRTASQIPFTPRAKKALELALREALALGHNDIGTEHLLLGLLRIGEGTAVDVLLDVGLAAEDVRERVVGMLGEAPPAGPRLRRRRRWAYRVEELGALATNDELQRLGADGWELVTVVGEPGAYRGVLKRPA